MAEKLTLLEVDVLAGTETIRELTNQELADLEIAKAELEQKLQAQAAKVAARESALAKLAALGLTEAEIAAL